MADFLNSITAPEISPGAAELAINLSPIIPPARTFYPGDLMDRALDKLRTAHLALAPDNEGWHSAETLRAIWGTIEQAIQDLDLVRNRLQGVEDDGDPKETRS